MHRIVAVALLVLIAGSASPVAAVAAQCSIESFRSGFNHRVPADAWIVYDAETDPNNRLGRPGFYTAKASWHDARLAPLNGRPIDSSTGGTIEIFSSQFDLLRRWDVLAAFDGTLLATGYRYAQGQSLVRASLDYTPDQAAVLQDILASC